MTSPNPNAKILLLIAAAPLLLMLLAILDISTISVFPAGVVGSVLGLSIIVGVAVLVTLIIFRVKHKITFSETAIWLSTVFAVLDIAIPVALFAFLLYALRSLHF